jgi:hypothetical protein
MHDPWLPFFRRRESLPANFSRSCIMNFRWLVPSAQFSVERLPRTLFLLLTVAAVLLPSPIRAQTVSLHLTGQIDTLQDTLGYFPAVSVGSNFSVDMTYSVNTALYSQAYSHANLTVDNLFLPSEDLVSWTAFYPGRTVHHDDIIDNVGMTNSNFFSVSDLPADFGDQVFVQTDRRHTVAAVTDSLIMQLVLSGPGTAFPGDAQLMIPSELSLAPWTFMKSFAVQYSDGATATYGLAYGEIDTLTILDMPGFRFDNPLIPGLGGIVCHGDICSFAVAGTATPDHGVNGPLWFDPAVAVGYDYQVDSGPNISGVELPAGFGDDQYDVYYYDEALMQFVFAATVGDAEPLDLTTFDAAGFARIRVLGIETDAMLDPGDPLAFPTGLTFLTAGQVELTMTSITAVPAPSSLLLVAIAAVVGLCRRRVPLATARFS